MAQRVRRPTKDEMVCLQAAQGQYRQRVKAERQIQQWRKDRYLSAERRKLLARYYDGEFKRKQGREHGPMPKGDLTREAMCYANKAKRRLKGQGVKWGVNRMAAEKTVEYLMSKGRFVSFKTIHDNLKNGRYRYL